MRDIATLTALPDDALVDRPEAASVIALKLSTLCSDASTGRLRLPFLKLGGSVRYQMGDLRAWLAARRVMHTGEVQGAAK